MKRKAIFYMALTSVIYGFFVVGQKAALNMGLNPLSIPTSVAVITFTVCAIYLLTKRSSIRKINRRRLIYLIILGICASGIPILLGYLGTSLTSATNVGFVWKFSSVFTLPFAYFMIKEKLTRASYWGVSIMFAGAFLLSTNGELRMPALGDSLIMLATVFLGFTNVFAKKLMKNIPTDVVSAFRIIFGASFMFLFVPLFLGTQTFGALFEGFWMIVLLSVFALSFIFTFYRSIKIAGPSNTATFFLTSSIITAMGAAVFLGEIITAVQIVGGALILGGGYILVKKIQI